MNFTNSKGLLRRLSLRLRLTKKTDYGYTTISNHSKFIKPIDKLGQLEDIEEELGIDLKVYHKLMSILYYGDEPNILYVKDRDEIIQVGILEIDYCKQKVCLYSHNTENDYVYGVYGFWQYGKNWSLDKSDLMTGELL